jgi:hypothetical protein
MSKLDTQAAYTAEMAQVAKFLPTRFVKEVRDKLPHKPIARIKNARSCIVQDDEVLAVLREISERERKRREDNALKELVATRSGLNG